MELEITNKKVKQPKYKLTYKIKTDYHSNQKSTYTTIDKQELISILKLYIAYDKKVKENWNEWCNIELNMIQKVAESEGIDFYSLDIYDGWWEEHNEYDCFALPTSWNVSYFNENGIEYKVNIKE